MNGTTLRFATAVACVAALAAPSAALAKKHRATKAKTPAPTIIVNVPHTYDAGGNGAGPLPVPAGVRVDLFDPLQLAAALGDQALAQLGLPPLAQTAPITLPEFP